MAYSAIEQLSFDLNWYFYDRFKHICHATSAGGMLPRIISERDISNDEFHKIIIDLPEKYQVGRNQNVRKLLSNMSEAQIERYFSFYEGMARRGLFSFDRYSDNDVNDPNYILVAYPLSDSYSELLAQIGDALSLIPRTKATITNKRFKNSFDLNNYFRQGNVF